MSLAKKWAWHAAMIAQDEQGELAAAECLLFVILL